MVRRETFLQAGGLHPGGQHGGLPLAPFSDVDLCLKLMDQGYRNVWTPYAELTWRRRPGRAVPDPARTQLAAVAMRQRWGHRLEADRYWNPNLSSEHARLSLIVRPRTTGKVALHRN
jgi:hypothetical protein